MLDWYIGIVVASLVSEILLTRLCKSLLPSPQGPTTNPSNLPKLCSILTNGPGQAPESLSKFWNTVTGLADLSAPELQHYPHQRLERDLCLPCNSMTPQLFLENLAPDS